MKLHKETDEYEEYPTMTGKPFDTSRMAIKMGYGNIIWGLISRR